MTTIKNKFFIAAGLAGMLSLGTGAALLAQGPGGPGGGPGMQMGRGGPGGKPGRGPGGGGMALRELGLRQLDLTDAQREQVRGIMQSHQQEQQQLAERVRNARNALHDAVTAGTFDEAAVRAKASELAAVEADGAVLRAKVHSEVFGILTVEQQQKLKDARAKAEERMKQRSERREQRRQQ